MSIAEQHRSRALRKAAAAVLGTIMVALAMLGSASTASAHDVVEGTNPADGSTVASLPLAISITLDNTPGALGSAVQVKDASGKDWAQGSVQVLDHVASQPLKSGAPAGKYTVLWRLVSSDSHPIEGTFSFTASAGAAGGSVAGTPVPLQSTTAVAPVTQPAAGFPWGIAVTIGVLVLAVGALGIFARRRLNRAED
jgi:copper resistance protein C